MFIPFLFWLPAVVSAVALLGLWHFRDLTVKAGLALGGWFAAALVVEWLARPMTPVWAGAVAVQAILAIVLVTWWKMTE
jgi:hypothetical protein